MFNLEPVPNAVNLTPGEFVFDKPITLCIKENFLSFHGVSVCPVVLDLIPRLGTDTSTQYSQP